MRYQSKPELVQPTLAGFPLVCDFADCEGKAVCAVYRKDDPDFVVNVCREHFEQLKHRPYREGEEATP